MPSPYRELLLRAERDHKPYRLWCEVRTDPNPSPDRLKRMMAPVLDQFVADMEKQGWRYVNTSVPQLKGPFPVIEPMTIRPAHVPTAREMLPGVLQGAPYRAGAETLAQAIPTLAFEERWVYRVGLAFHRPQILTERPDAHEEQR